MIGVGVIAFDRPHYLRRTLASLEQQRDAPEMRVHLFLDGAVNAYSGRVCARERDIERTRTVFERSRLANKRAHVQSQNQGIGLHQYAATEWMIASYDRVMMLEDDVVLSPHWMRCLGILFEQFADDESAFGFCPGFRRLGTDLDALRVSWSHWWCEAFTATAWRRMRPFYRDYLHIIEGVDYARRDHDAIYALYAQHNWVHPASSQDAGKDMAICRAGMHRVVCEVNRALGIGRTGQHFTPGLFEAGGFDRQTPYIHEIDATRERFNEPIDSRTDTATG